MPTIPDGQGPNGPAASPLLLPPGHKSIDLAFTMGTIGGHSPGRPVHRCPGKRRHSRLLCPVAHSERPGKCQTGRGRSNYPLYWIVPEQGQEPDSDRQKAGQRLCLPGTFQHAGVAHPARGGQKDGQYRALPRFRPARRYRCGHACQASQLPAWLECLPGSQTHRARSHAPVSPNGLGGNQPPPGLVRPGSLSGPVTKVHRMLSCRYLSLFRGTLMYVHPKLLWSVTCRLQTRYVCPFLMVQSSRFTVHGYKNKINMIG